MSAPTLTLSEATALASHTVAPCECTEPDAECTACEGHGHTCIICGDAWCTACWETADHNDGCKREVLPDGSIREAIGDTTTDLLGGFTRTLRVLAKDADDNGEPRAAMAYRWVLSSYGGDVARLRAEVERLGEALRLIATGHISPAMGLAERVLDGEDPHAALTAEIAMRRAGR